MRLISNEEMAIVAGGESTTSRADDGPAQKKSITIDDVPIMPSYGDISPMQYLACVGALAKVEAGWTPANVAAAAATCAPVVQDLIVNQLSPTNIGAEQGISDRALPSKANQY
ncbi:MAG: hypothetical protein WA071_10200 [Undibacterium umbellatum]|uniref:hypothetical protein n=1 Tax=Undibacterium umbellatum TaxID=2762300 RepID=UPI003BB4CA73